MSTTRNNELERNMINWVKENDLISSGDTVVCGVSGGIDSMVLVKMLSTVKNKLGINVVAAHFNHHIRGEESDRDEQFVRDYCEANSIRCFVEQGDVLGRLTRTKESVEEAARVLRYEFFDNVCKQMENETGHTCKLATAHHANDNFETILMNMIRGTATGGLAGIPVKRDNIIRPLLWCTRANIEEYAKNAGIDHVEDSTNGCDDYLRNRIRHQFIPLFIAENPNVLEGMVRTASNVRCDSKFLNKKAHELVEKASVGLGLYNTTVFNTDKAIESRAVYQILQQYGYEASSKNIDDVIRCIHSKNKPSRVCLSGKIVVLAESDYLHITSSDEINATIPEVELPIGGSVFLKKQNLTASCSEVFAVEKIDKNPQKLIVNLSTIEGKLRIRSRKDGDKLKTPGGTKPIGKLLRSKGIPEYLRDSYPIIEDDNGIIGIPGISLDDSRKVEVGDFAVKISVMRGKEHEGWQEI